MAYKGRKRKTPIRKKGGSPLFLWVILLCAVVAAAAWWIGGPASDKKEVQPAPAQSVTAPVKSGVQEKEEHSSPAKKEVSPKKEKQPAKAEPAHKEEKKTASPVRTASGHGRLAVCIDDGGYDLESQRIYEKLGIPLTLAVMPNQTHTGTAAAQWAASGLEVILHQPMESISGETMEKTAILTSMDDAQIRTVLSRSLAQVPQAVGINNHQGSKATADSRVMEVVMKELQHRGLFFFDSRTNRDSVGTSTARAYGVPAVNNELFIDNDPDEDAIRARLRQGANIALRDGQAVIIGHCRPHTAAAFSSMVTELQSMGIEFIFLSSLVR